MEFWQNAKFIASLPEPLRPFLDNEQRVFMRSIFFMFLAAMALTGCVTKAVVRASEERDVDLDPGTVPLRLMSASVLQEASAAGPQSRLYLCITRQGEPEKSVLVRIAQSYPFTDDDHSAYLADSGLVVLPAGNPSNLFDGCSNPAGTSLVRQLPIVEAARNQRVTLPDGATEAVVASSRGESGLGLAYASATPISGGYHAVTLDLSASPLYVEHRAARPYLLLLTPLTALHDATGAFIVYYAVSGRWLCRFAACSDEGR